MLNLLVTGTSGYLGNQIAEYFRSSGKYSVLTIAHRKNFSQALEQAFRQPIDIVVHAGFHVDFSPMQTPTDIHHNCENMRLLLQACEQNSVRQFIFLSAAAVLGVGATPFPVRNEAHWCQSDMPHQDWMATRYVQEKIACEKMLAKFSCHTLVLYLSTTYGQGMQAQVRHSLLRLRRQYWIIYPSGGTSFLDLEDLFGALCLAIEQRLSGNYILSSGNLTYKQLFAAAHPQSRWQFWFAFPKFLLPLLLFWKRDAVLHSSFAYKYYSSTKFMRATGWQPRAQIQQSMHRALTLAKNAGL